MKRGGKTHTHVPTPDRKPSLLGSGVACRHAGGPQLDVCGDRCVAVHTNRYLVQIMGGFCFLFSIFQIFSPVVTFYNETVFFSPVFFFF